MSDDVEQILRDYIAADPLNAVAIEAITKWEAKALAHQKIPEGDWLCWLLNAGRGAGKTRVGAQTVLKWGWLNRGCRILVSAPTYGDLISVCFEGESGLLNVIPTELIEPTSSGTLFNRTDVELKLKNGTLIKGISAEKPDRFRGWTSCRRGSATSRAGISSSSACDWASTPALWRRRPRSPAD